jgi:hypothetical protein
VGQHVVYVNIVETPHFHHIGTGVLLPEHGLNNCHREIGCINVISLFCKYIRMAQYLRHLNGSQQFFLTVIAMSKLD